VSLKSTVLRFLERRNYALVHADVLEKERIAATNNLARLQLLEARMIPAETPGRRPKLEVPPVAPPPEANDLKAYAHIFDDITPWSGIVPEGFEVDFLGTRTSKKFFQPWGDNTAIVGGANLQTERPWLGRGRNGEFWFEAADWVLAAREARGRFVMITLGALYGYQAVGSQRALQLLNPMPYTLVAVEPDPENMEWVRTHMRDNGIDPGGQWLLQAAIGPTNAPAFFPIGSPGSGAPNCISSNEEHARKNYLQHFIAHGRTEEALENILLHNSTGLQKDLIEGKSFFAEIKLVSTVTLQDVLGPFERVDLLESDIQESEIVVFPPCRDLLKRKVHRMHIGTHGKDTHRHLLKMFRDDGWRIVFAYEPESTHETVFGPMVTNDGVLSVLNPNV
jgi:hypothetical protein